MGAGPRTTPSFSHRRRWGMGFNAILAAVMALAVLVMLNYLSSHYFQRIYLSTRTGVELSSRTVHLLHTLTNHIHITLFYSKEEPMYSDVAQLLKEYHSNNPRITVSTVDYYRDPGGVQELKAKYNLGASTNKNLVLFDCEGRTKIVDGNALVQYTFEQVPNDTEREYRKKPVAFNGEMMFTAAILAVINPKPFQACYLQGHGEHRLDDAGDAGYAQFASVLRQNYVDVQPLTLVGSNSVPLDCSLLIIAGPTDVFPPDELDQIDHYLSEGGRLLVLFNMSSKGHAGLEKILAKWGVQVGTDTIKDPENTTGGSDVVVNDFRGHPVVNPLTGRRLRLILPREISHVGTAAESPEGVRIDEIAFSGPRSYLLHGGAAQNKHAMPVMVAVEKAALKGMVPQRGTTRILVIGDSLFLDNQLIDLDYAAPNRDFAGYAVNWLLDRTLLLEGASARPVTEYRLLATRSQVNALNWILLAAIPGGVLFLGGMVWLRRRS